MKVDLKAALFLMLGQAAERTISKIEDVVPKDSLLLSKEYDLSGLVPDKVRRAVNAAEAYKLFFVFEAYLRELIVDVLSKEGETLDWWDKVPGDVKIEVARKPKLVA